MGSHPANKFLFCHTTLFLSKEPQKGDFTGTNFCSVRTLSSQQTADFRQESKRKTVTGFTTPDLEAHAEQITHKKQWRQSPKFTHVRPHMGQCEKEPGATSHVTQHVDAAWDPDANAASVDVEFPEGLKRRVTLGPLALVQSERVARQILDPRDDFRFGELLLHVRCKDGRILSLCHQQRLRIKLPSRELKHFSDIVFVGVKTSSRKDCDNCMNVRVSVYEQIVKKISFCENEHLQASISKRF